MSTEPISPTSPDAVDAPTSTSCPGPTRASGRAWPTPPQLPVRARIAEALFRRAVRTLPVRVVLPGGERIGARRPGVAGDAHRAPAAFFHRLGADSKIGFGESYMAGDWTSTHLAALLTPFAARLSTLIPPAAAAVVRRYVEARQPARGAQHRRGRRGRTSTATTTCPTSCSRCSSTRR